MLHRRVSTVAQDGQIKTGSKRGPETIQNINTEYNSTRIDLTELTWC